MSRNDCAGVDPCHTGAVSSTDRATTCAYLPQNEMEWHSVSSGYTTERFSVSQPEESPVDTRDAPPQSARADVRRNHERLLAAARDVFVQHGVDASLNEVAR